LLVRAHANRAGFVTSLEAAHSIAALLSDLCANLAIHVYAADLAFSGFLESLIATVLDGSDAADVVPAAELASRELVGWQG